MSRCRHSQRDPDEYDRCIRRLADDRDTLAREIDVLKVPPPEPPQPAERDYPRGETL